MCGGGGGGAPSGPSETDKIIADEKKRREEEEARRMAAVTRINTFYGLSPDGLSNPTDPTAKANALAREQGYQRVHDNTMGIYNEDISRNHGDASRAMRFGLARSGLAGGSVDADEMGNLANAFARSVATANRQADSQVAGLRSNDEMTRADLISRINAGLDADSAASMAANRAGANYSKEISQPAVPLDNLFSGLAGFWNNYQQGIGAYQGRQYQPSAGSVGSFKGRTTVGG